MGAIAFLHSKTPRTFLTVRLADMQASSRNASDIHFSTQCVSLKSSLKRARTRVVLSRTLSPILKSLISKSVMMLHRLLSLRSTVLVGNEELFSVTPAQVCDCSQSCTQMAQHGLSCLSLRIARSPSCVSVMKGVCFLRTMMERSTWRPMPVTSVLYGGTFRSNGMATQSLAIQNGHGNIWVTRMHGCSCRRASVGLESCGSFGLCRLQGANFSAVSCLRFLVQPNLELQRFHCRCYDNVYRGLREHLNEKKDCNFMDCVN